MRSYLSFDNRRGNTYGAGLKGGSDVHTRGWRAGVNVTVRYAGPKDETDVFEVWMTAGSNGGSSSVYLGTVAETPDGPVWTARVETAPPVTLPAAEPARRARRTQPSREPELYEPYLPDDPARQPRMSDEARGMARSALELAINTLLGMECTSSWCSGPDIASGDTVTCHVCAAIQDLRAELARITR